MRYAAFTVSLPEFTPEEACRHLADARYDGVEWRVVDQADAPDGVPGFWVGNRCTWPMRTFRSQAAHIRRLTESAGLAMPTVGTYVQCMDVRSVDTAMRATVRLGAPCLRVGVPGYDGRESYLRVRDRAISAYRDVEALARQYGLRALIEIHMGNIVPSASAAAAFAANFDPRWVGIIHDAGNMVYEGHENYRLGMEVLGPYLAHVHLKSAKWEPAGAREDGSTEWRPTFAAIDRGIVDFAALLRALIAVGYDGWLSFEDFSSDVALPERLKLNIAYMRGVEARVRGESL